MYSSTGLEKSQRNIKYILIFFVFALTIFGILMVFSASQYKVELHGISRTRVIFKEIIRLLFGIVAFFLGWKIDPKVYRKKIDLVMILTIAGLAITYILGSKMFGAVRWLRIGILGFQPSELAKLVVIFYIATKISRERSILKNCLKLLKTLVMPFIATLLILIQPNLSSAFILALVILSVLFLAGIKIKYILIPTLMALLFAGATLQLFPNKFSHVRTRIQKYLKGEKPYQVEHALVAIAQGGPVGKGLGRSTQKYYYLPMAENDFIFALIGEEGGFVMVFLIIAAYAVIVGIGLHTASKHLEANFYYSLVAFGIVCMIFLTSAIHIGVNLGILPATGQTLPFISHGGTSLAVNLFSTGIIVQLIERASEYESL